MFEFSCARHGGAVPTACLVAGIVMTNLVQAKNGVVFLKFRNVFKPRDIFFHDGKSLRRVSVGVPVQMVAALAALFLIGWSAFAAAQVATARTVDPAEVARMEQQVQSMQADVQAIKAMADKRYQMTEQALRERKSVV